jgi:phage-related protein (TIGR01555 family)
MENEKRYTKARILQEPTKSSVADGLENLIAEVGTGQDKRAFNAFVNKRQLTKNTNELNAMYRTDWLSGKVVDIIPDDMTREWREFDGEIDPDIVREIVEFEERIDLRGKFNYAHKLARLYGTAFILLAVEDGQTPDKPMVVETLKPDCLKHITVLDCLHMKMYGAIPVVDPFSPNYGMPEFYQVAQTGTVVHHSRVLRFDGVRLPYDEFRRANFQSDSVLDRMYEAITNFNVTSVNAASMVYETNVDVVKVRGLMNYLQTKEGENLLRKRFTLAGLMKSFNNMLLLDADEDFNTKTNTFSGLPDLIDRFGLALSAAADIPATRLMGSSASGFNATGEGDLKNYYDKIRSLQISEYKPKLDYFDAIMAKCLALDGSDLDYRFGSLFQMTPEQEAALQKLKSERDAIYLDRDVILLSTVAKELQQDGTYTNITDEYIDELEQAEAAVEISFEAGVMPNGESADPTGADIGETGNEEQAESAEQEAGEEDDTEEGT